MSALKRRKPDKKWVHTKVMWQKKEESKIFTFFISFDGLSSEVKPKKMNPFPPFFHFPPWPACLFNNIDCHKIFFYSDNHTLKGVSNLMYMLILYVIQVRKKNLLFFFFFSSWFRVSTARTNFFLCHILPQYFFSDCTKARKNPGEKCGFPYRFFSWLSCDKKKRRKFNLANALNVSRKREHTTLTRNGETYLYALSRMEQEYQIVCCHAACRAPSWIKK